MTTTPTKIQPNGGSTSTELYWDPFSNLTSLRRMMDSFFFETFDVQPRANVYEKDGTYVIECAVPGYKKEDVTVEAKGNEVTISGNYSQEKGDQQKQYRRREIRQGSFSRTIAFPQDIDHDRVSAALENGVLKVELYPVKATSAKKIPVTSK